MNFTKRIAIVITAQHMISYGGVGQFAKSISELAMENGCIVDIILDCDEYKKFFNVNGNYIIPDEILPLTQYRSISGMFGNYLRLETSINIRNSLMKGLKKYIYDMIIINSPDALYGVQSLCLVENIPTIFYTHAENIIDKTLKAGPVNLYCDDVIRNLLKDDKLITGTQLEYNKNILKNDNIESLVLPMPIPEPKLKEEVLPINEKDGILFIGRIEDRKNFDDFIKIVKNTDYKIKIMTSEKDMKKAEKILLDNGIKNYEIKGSIIGEEKVNFIKTSKVMICTSKRESYCFALNESLFHCHCIVLEKYDWWKILNCPFLYCGNISTIKTYIKDIYNKNISDDQRNWVLNRECSIWDKWEKIFKPIIKSNKSNKPNKAKINSYDDFILEDFYNDLNRDVSVTDITTVYNYKDEYDIFQYKDITWFTKNNKKPNQINKKNNLFFFEED